VSIDRADIEAVIASEAEAPTKTPFRLPDQIKAGQRHLTLFKMLRSQKLRGFPFDAAVAACEIVNRDLCKPPLEITDKEFERWWDEGDGNLEAAVQHADRVRTAAEKERTLQEARRIVATEKRGPVPTLCGLSLSALARTQFPERRAILSRGDAVVLREGHLGQIYSVRGVGKTWFVHTLALVAAYGINALGFSNPTPCRVLIIDGEMSSGELQERSANLCRMLNVPDATTGALTIIAADWQDEFLPRLDTPEGQEAVEPFVEQAHLIIADNRSCLFDSEGEKDPTAWQPAQEWLLSLRRRGKAVLLAHHSNRQGGARGISKAEDPMDLLLKLTRPEDYRQDQGARFIVTFDKARGVYGAAAVPFIASLTQHGWKVEPVEREDSSTEIKIRDYLETADALGERPTSATAVVRGAGVNKASGLEALAALVKTGEVRKEKDGYHVRVESSEVDGATQGGSPSEDEVSTLHALWRSQGIFVTPGACRCSACRDGHNEEV
jgi:AAA domain